MRFRIALALSLVITGALAFTMRQALALGSNSAATPLAAPGRAIDEEKPFLAENQIAMTKMMSDMTVAPTGDADHDFVAMMVPHHQGAIDMAVAELRYGHNEQLRRLAQEIIVTQQEEIAAMRLALGERLPPSVASPTTPSRAPAAP